MSKKVVNRPGPPIDGRTPQPEIDARIDLWRDLWQRAELSSLILEWWPDLRAELLELRDLRARAYKHAQVCKSRYHLDAASDRSRSRRVTALMHNFDRVYNDTVAARDRYHNGTYIEEQRSQGGRPYKDGRPADVRCARPA